MVAVKLNRCHSSDLWQWLGLTAVIDFITAVSKIAIVVCAAIVLFYNSESMEAIPRIAWWGDTLMHAKLSHHMLRTIYLDDVKANERCMYPLYMLIRSTYFEQYNQYLWCARLPHYLIIVLLVKLISGVWLYTAPETMHQSVKSSICPK